MPDKTGQQIGNYRLVRLLGSGGFAEVYLGQHVHVKSLQVAIKVLHTRLGPNYHAGFLQEAETIARLRHPHIIRILDFGIESGESAPYLIMDYAPQGTLRNRHPSGSLVPLATVAVYVEQIASALQYAHDRNLVHRDLKPENLLVGENGEILLSDFGIAAIAHSTSSLDTSIYAGTAPYSAPEQIMGKPRRESDQYALGIIIYEWLSGKRPFQGTIQEIIFQHLAAPPPSLHEKGSTTPPGVEEVVIKALAKDPHQRFASVYDLAVVFEQACIPTLPVEEPVPGRGISDKEMPPEQSSRQKGDGGQPPQRIPGEGVPSQPTPPSVTSVSTADQSLLQIPVVAHQSQIRDAAPSHTTPVVPTSTRVSVLPGELVDNYLILRGKLWIGLVLLLVVLLSVIGGVGVYTIHSSQVNVDATATAAANTATAQVTATGQAAINLTATAQVAQTATVVAQNPDPYPPNHGKLALYDSLSQPGQWDKRSNDSFGGACQFTNGTYHVSQSKTPNFSVQCPSSSSFDNFAFEVQMRIIKGDCGGIVFRDDSTNGKLYSFEVCQNGNYYLVKYAGFKAADVTVLPTPSNDNSAINMGLNQTNVIAVVADGNTISLFVNSKQIASVQDNSYTTGQIGMFAVAYNNPTEVVYSNAKVWTLS